MKERITCCHWELIFLVIRAKSFGSLHSSASQSWYILISEKAKNDIREL